MSNKATGATVGENLAKFLLRSGVPETDIAFATPMNIDITDGVADLLMIATAHSIHVPLELNEAINEYVLPLEDREYGRERLLMYM